MEHPDSNSHSDLPADDSAHGGVETVDHVVVDVGPERGNLVAANGGGRVDPKRGGVGAAGNGGDRGVDAPRDRREENLAESEIYSLLWLEDPENEPENKVLARALKAWEKKDELFARRIDRKRKQSNSITNEIYQLVGFYSVFQGVLLTAVAQSNLLQFNNWWTAFFLSLLASLVTIGGVVQKFLAVLALELTIKNEESTRKECVTRVQKLKFKRQEFNFKVDAKDAKNQKFDLTKLWLSAVAILIILVFFSGLFLASIYEILCHPDSSSVQSATSGGG